MNFEMRCVYPNGKSHTKREYELFKNLVYAAWEKIKETIHKVADHFRNLLSEFIDRIRNHGKRPPDDYIRLPKRKPMKIAPVHLQAPKISHQVTMRAPRVVNQRSNC